MASVSRKPGIEAVWQPIKVKIFMSGSVGVPGRGDLTGLKRRSWWGILHCTHVFEAEGMTTEQRLRAAHALSQLAMTFMTVAEVTDLQARVDVLEHLVNRRNGDGKPLAKS
jgi:hypothetical protein